MTAVRPTPEAQRLARLDMEKLSRLHLLHVKVPDNIAPPRRRCGDRAVHDQHLFEAGEGLIWTCPGHRGSSR